MISISKSYGRHMVLENVSLKVSPGEVVGLLGSDGAGKTVFFYVIIGITDIDSGSILLGNQEIAHLTVDERARLGLTYLPQEPSIFRGMSTAENVMAVLEQYEPDAEARERRLEELLSDFNIAYVRDVDATKLSGGERRRCEIARALAASPRIILLDEPFAGIDPLSIVNLKAMIRDLKRRNIGVLISDNNVPEMLSVVDRVYILHDGNMLFEGTPEAMLKDSEVRHLYLGPEFALSGRIKSMGPFRPGDF